MGRYIYGARNGIHILDLTQTVPLLDAALQAMWVVRRQENQELTLRDLTSAAVKVAPAVTEPGPDRDRYQELLENFRGWLQKLHGEG